MMRENMGLYHGKRRDTGEWVEGYLAGYNLICMEEPQEVRHATGEYYDQIAYVGFIEVDPSTVGQFTGLPDKNGKRIFEGDLVIPTNRRRLTNKPQVVKYDPLSGYWQCAPARDPVVIGNIHDSELLEVNEDE